MFILLPQKNEPRKLSADAERDIPYGIGSALWLTPTNQTHPVLRTTFPLSKGKDLSVVAIIHKICISVLHQPSLNHTNIQF